MRTSSRKSSVLFLLLVLLSACAPSAVVQRPQPDAHEGPVTAELLMKSVGFRDTKTLKALTDVNIYRNGEHAGSFSGVFGYQAPSSLRTSFFGPFGITMMDMLVSPDILQLSVPARGMIYEAPSGGMQLLSLHPGGRYSYRVEDEGDFYVLESRDSGNGDALFARYYFDRPFLLNRAIRIYKDGDEMARVDFEDFNGTIPLRARVMLPKESGVEIVMREPEFDTEIPSSYFALLDRGTMRVRPLQELLKRFDPSR